MDALEVMKGLAADCVAHAMAGRRDAAEASARRLERLQDETARRALRNLLRGGASEAERQAATARLNDSVLLGAIGECALELVPPTGFMAHALTEVVQECMAALSSPWKVRMRRAAELDAMVALARAGTPDMLRLASGLERLAELVRAVGRAAPALERAA